ncbi:hypothetical protein [uncultured Formosa sp.]|uniref:hypothetical protein n=1 Tax=uncultured Formosa sp. TaxID=255435 RepID=UPI00263508D3|nr:hypothetical protein [uncultured Formosa sp.]
MGLTISSGILVDLKENEPDSYEGYKVIFENINTILIKNGVEPYQEPVVMERTPLQFGGFPYSFLHHLRRFLAHAWENEDNENWEPKPFSSEEDPTGDAVLEDHYSYMSSHLLTHSDAEGFYLPVELPEVLFDTEKNPVPGAMIGSSYSLLKELKSLTKHLGIGLDENNMVTNIDELNKIISNEGDFWIEILVCVTLMDAAKFSIENNTAILFN